MAILLELQARPSVRAEDLAQHFEVSVRTMYRDLEALSESGVPLVATPGKGYQLMDGYFLPPLAFTASEAALLVLGGEFIKQRVDAELHKTASSALQKLHTVLPQDKREAVTRWRGELLFSPMARASDDPRLPALRAAMQDRRVVRLQYHAFRRAQPEEREIEPISMLYFGERWHVGAYCRLRQGPRLFRLDRIDSFDVLAEHFTLTQRHVIPDYSDDWKAGAPEVRVRFHPAVERWVRERQPFTFVREERDEHGPVFVYAVRREDDLVRWLLAWGASAEVLSPPELRARLAAEAWVLFARLSAAPDIGVSRAELQAGVEA
jgi:predicted DNA-binding transcriptional regulator YafY